MPDKGRQIRGQNRKERETGESVCWSIKDQKEGNNTRSKGPETEVEEAWRGMLEYCQWQRAVVCTKQLVAIKWEMTEESISKKFGFKAVLKHFSDNKATIICPSTNISRKISKLGFCNFGEVERVEICQRDPFANI